MDFSPLTSKNNVEFVEGIIFNSQFDSGNMMSVNQITESNYEVFISSDCENIKELKTRYRVWFYFYVINNSKSLSITINIVNLSNLLKKILGEGHIPVYKNEKEDIWIRLSTEIHKFKYEIRQFGIDISFIINMEKNIKYFFAFSYPWNYSDDLKFYKNLKQNFLESKEIYYYNETLIYSLEKRKIKLITLTSKNNSLKEKEKKFNKNLFSKKSRPLQFDKKYIIFSARVHPGETPSSYILEGIIDFLQNNALSKRFLDHFVLLIIPILNPDGVYHGHYRLDTNGENLNRVYNSASLEKHPSIYAIKKLIDNLQKNKKFFGFFDLHAHNNVDGSFIFGNKGNNLEHQIDINLIPKIMSIICDSFYYENCAFRSIDPNENEKTENKDSSKIIEKKENNIEEKKIDIAQEELSPLKIKNKKKVEGKVAKTFAFNLTQHPHCYTMECNYNGLSIKNKENSEIVDKKLIFDNETFKNLGRKLIISIMEFYQLIQEEESILKKNGMSIEDLKNLLKSDLILKF